MANDEYDVSFPDFLSLFEEASANLRGSFFSKVASPPFDPPLAFVPVASRRKFSADR